MHLVLFSSLLGAALCTEQVTSTENTDSLTVHVSVWPPGSNLHQGETVLLHCSVQSNSSSVWAYHWFRDAPFSTLVSGPRIWVCGVSLSIRGVSRQDQGRYWCRARLCDGNRTVEVQSRKVDLRVRDLPGPTLTMTPDSQYIFSGEHFMLHCPKFPTNSSNWSLWHFTLDNGVRCSDLRTDHCSPLVGMILPDESNGCMFSAASGSSGLYWCESAGDRTNAVNITVSYAPLILRTPSSPVPLGHRAILYCQYQTDNHSHTSFYKNRAKMYTSKASHSNKTIMMTIENVTQEHEGFYKCKSEDTGIESEESWFSVQTSQGTTPEHEADATNGPGLWIIVSCTIVLLFLVSVSVWLIWRNRYKVICTNSWRPHHTQDIPSVDPPVTKQDVTEVQWDLSWMEMTNLLDKNLYPGK
ncbi:protein CEPU-1-like [Boleophthalmus pectinirostris]|uniref:protein CEPU-1-like n=1 Tax=Boleophthalmus pectinirostris TaxID=150288 RepID=UPI000A1C5C76|nr:protein CEPU-1-like [Boleophthalmus pectinirostris]